MDGSVEQGRLLTGPNLLSLVRLAGAPFLLVLAWLDQPQWVVALFLALVAADWLDGRIARRTGQVTRLGSRLDSIGDAVLYGFAVLAVLWLRPELWQQEWPWLLAALASYAAALAAAMLKFGQIPSYHTRSAKLTWGLATFSLVLVLLDWAIWPFRLAMLAVVLTNLESIAITRRLRQPRSDVPSWWHVREGSQHR